MLLGVDKLLVRTEEFLLQEMTGRVSTKTFISVFAVTIPGRKRP